MRIIAGRAKGRRLSSPPGGGTRPPTGKMRESVFSTLGAEVEGARVLDLYAGSGSFGLEALSRGAADVVFVEKSRRVLDVLRANVEAVALGGRIVAGDAARALDRAGGPFDLVFVDPPYALSDSAVAGVLALLEPQVAPGGLVLLHRRRDHEQPEGAGTLRLTDERRYGDAIVLWYRKEAP